jgi:transcriptional regulator with XRE-family HTH domain
MPRERNEYEIAVAALKRGLKAQNLTYQELAKELGLSESGIKKILTAKDGSFQRLAQICRIAGLSFADLLEEQREEMHPVSFTEKQEEYFLAEPGGFQYFWRLVYERASVEEIERLTGLSAKDSFRHLRKLDSLGLIKLLPGGKVRVPPLQQIRWAGSGPLVRKLYREWSLRFVEQVARPDLEANKLFIVRYFQMTKKTYAEFLEYLRNTEAEFLRRAIQDMRSGAGDLQHVRFLVAADDESFLPAAGDSLQQ